MSAVQGGVPSAIADVDIEALKARAQARWRERQELCEALTLDAVPLELGADGAAQVQTPLKASRSAALTHFAAALQRPAADLRSKWQAGVLATLPPEGTSIKAEVEQLARLRESRAKAEQHVRECKERKDEASQALETALRREEKSNHGLRRMRHHHHAKNLEHAKDEQTKCAQGYHEAVEELEERNQLCMDMTQQVLKDISDEESAHSRGLREVMHAAVLALEDWAQDTRGAIMELKRQGRVPEDFNGEGAYDDERHWLTSRNSTVALPPDTPTQSTAAGRSGSSSSDSESSASDREESVTSPEFYEQQVARAAEENEALHQSLRGQQLLASGVPPSSPSSPITEEALLRLAKENRELEHSFRERRPRMKRTCADLEQDVFALESLAHACVAAVDQTGRGNATSSSARPPVAEPSAAVAMSASRPAVIQERPGDAARNPRPSTPVPPLPLSTMVSPTSCVAPVDAADGQSFGPTLSGSSEHDVNVMRQHSEEPRMIAATTSRFGENTPSNSPDNRSSMPWMAERSERLSVHSDTYLQDSLDEEDMDSMDMSIRPRLSTWITSGDQLEDSGMMRPGQSEEAILGIESTASWAPGSFSAVRSEQLGDQARSSMPARLDDVMSPSPRSQRHRCNSRPDLSSISMPDGLESGTPRGSLAERPESISPCVTQRRPVEVASGLKGCLPPVQPAPGSRQVHQPAVEPEERVAAVVEQAFSRDPLEVALRKSDQALYKHHLGPENGYWNWKWEDYAVEEQHAILQRSTNKIAETFSSDEDWNLFSYELLLLLHETLLHEDPEEGVLEHVRATLPIFRVRLGINSAMHAHVAALSLPEDASQGYRPLDVRFRAALLLRSWARAESHCLACSDLQPEWTLAWTRRQLAVLKGSVIMRTLMLRHERAEAARAACGSCLQTLQCLEERLESGSWGKPNDIGDINKPGGRRLLAILMHELDALRPRENDAHGSSELGMWRLDTIFAANAFSRLWVAATDVYSDTSLSLDAPQVAAVLLSGLHPRVGTRRLQLDTHALLLAQQLWLALSSPSTASPAQGFQLPAEALRTVAKLLDDFSEWLQKTPVSASIFIPCRDSRGDGQAFAVEVTMRRLLSLELRDGLVNVLSDYRRHLDPEAFEAAILLWRRSHLCTTCSDELIQDAVEAVSACVADQNSPNRTDSLLEIAEQDEREGTEQPEQAKLFLHRMGQYFVWRSVRATAELALAQFDDPPTVPDGEDAWQKFGVKVKKHLDSLAGGVQALCDELECEQKFYNAAWDCHGLGTDHLGITAAALVSAVRPRVLLVVDHGLWPNSDSGVFEVPPGGGKLLHALEGLDRLANRWKEPLQDLKKPSEGTLVDILLVHVTRALASRFQHIEVDVIQRALEGRDDEMFKPLKEPTILHCDSVVTIWKFINDGLDAPINLGVPAALVVRPFLDFLTRILASLCPRLCRPEEKMQKFNLAVRAEHIVAELMNGDHEMESDEDEGAASGTEATARPERRRTRSGRKPWLKRPSSRAGVQEEDTTKNVLMCAALLAVDPATTARKPREVTVRLCSLGFCLAELKRIHNRLIQFVNSGDDVDCPTQRVNDARMMTLEKMPELEEDLEQIGKVLVKYLATRVIFHEMQQDLFERLYFVQVSRGSTTPRGGGDATPTSACLTLQGVIQRRGDSLVGLVTNAPVPLAAAFARELGTRLTQAWVVVILDYLRKQKRDALHEFLDDDQEVLRRFLNRLVQEARRRAGASTTGGSSDECDQCERELHKVQNSVSQLVVRVGMCEYSPEAMARYAEKILQDATDSHTGAPAQGITQTVTGGGDVRGRSHSPAPNHNQSQPTAARSPSVRVHTPRGKSGEAKDTTGETHERDRKSMTSRRDRDRSETEWTQQTGPAVSEADGADGHHRRHRGPRILAPFRGLRKAVRGHSRGPTGH